MITKGLKVHIKGAYNSGVSITKSVKDVRQDMKLFG